MAPHITEWIHKFELGEGARWVRAAAGLLACLAVGLLYLLFEYQNFRDPAAFDTAQVARHLARGEGFTTGLIRPLSVQQLERRAAALGLPNDDPGRLATPHPDLANPPLYPALLAGWFKIFGSDPAFGASGRFAVHGPDRVVVLFNLVLFLALLLATYGLAQRLFDGLVAALATTAVIGSAFFWGEAGLAQTSILGTLLTTLLAWGIVLFDESAREEPVPHARLLGWAAVLGLLTGLAALACYGLFLLVVPLVVLLLPIWPGRRWSTCLAALAALVIVVSPWLVRNYQLSGNPFGIAPAVLFADSPEFPGDLLERSFETRPTLPALADAAKNATHRLGGVLQRDLPTLGGSWVTAFFLVGLMFRFSDPTRNLLRGFTLLCLLALVPAHTWVGPGAFDTSIVRGTPYLAMVAPLVFVLGSAFFASLLDHVDWDVVGIRALVLGLFVLAAVAPMLWVLLPPAKNPLTFPPYHPPLIRELQDWTQPEELLLTDIPWAVAWYADRKAIWLPAYAYEPHGREDFQAIRLREQRLPGLYLTQLTTDARFASQILQPRATRERALARARATGLESSAASLAEAVGWPEFVLLTLGERRTLETIPFRSVYVDLIEHGQLLMMDRARWLDPRSATDEGPGQPARGPLPEVPGEGGQNP